MISTLPFDIPVPKYQAQNSEKQHRLNEFEICSGNFFSVIRENMRDSEGKITRIVLEYLFSTVLPFHNLFGLQHSYMLRVHPGKNQSKSAEMVRGARTDLFAPTTLGLDINKLEFSSQQIASMKTRLVKDQQSEIEKMADELTRVAFFASNYDHAQTVAAYCVEFPSHYLRLASWVEHVYMRPPHSIIPFAIYTAILPLNVKKFTLSADWERPGEVMCFGYDGTSQFAFGKTMQSRDTLQPINFDSTEDPYTIGEERPNYVALLTAPHDSGHQSRSRQALVSGENTPYEDLWRDPRNWQLTYIGIIRSNTVDSTENDRLATVNNTLIFQTIRHAVVRHSFPYTIRPSIEPIKRKTKQLNEFEHYGAELLDRIRHGMNDKDGIISHLVLEYLSFSPPLLHQEAGEQHSYLLRVVLPNNLSKRVRMVQGVKTDLSAATTLCVDLDMLRFNSKISELMSGSLAIMQREVTNAITQVEFFKTCPAIVQLVVAYTTPTHYRSATEWIEALYTTPPSSLIPVAIYTAILPKTAKQYTFSVTWERPGNVIFFAFNDETAGPLLSDMPKISSLPSNFTAPDDPFDFSEEQQPNYVAYITAPWGLARNKNERTPLLAGQNTPYEQLWRDPRNWQMTLVGCIRSETDQMSQSDFRRASANNSLIFRRIQEAICEHSFSTEREYALYDHLTLPKNEFGGTD